MLPLATAAKSPNSGDQHIAYQLLESGGVCNVQDDPSGLVITPLALLSQIAAKSPNWGDQHTAFQCWLFTLTVDQLVPFELVITVLLLATATNNPNWEDQHTASQVPVTVAVVQFIPSGLEAIIPEPHPTKSSNSGDQQTPL